MKLSKISVLSVSLLSAVAFGVLSTLSSCGDESGNAPPAVGTPSAESLGGFDFTCTDGNQQGQQQQQVSFKKQSCPSPQQQQQLQFQQSKLGDFDLRLDCSGRVVRVRNKGVDEKTQFLPIQSDGKVKGSLNFQQQIQNDGKGNTSCWLVFIVDFDGTAKCNLPSPSPTPTPTPTLTVVTNEDIQSLDLKTVVRFENTDPLQLQAAGIADPGTPIVSPSPTQTPTPTPTVSPTPGPTVTPIKICIVENPCALEGSTTLSCP